MRIITRKRIREYCLEHSEACVPLAAWYKIVSTTRFEGPPELKKTFQQIDYVDGFYVFNIGRSCRLIAAIKFRAQILYIRHVLTHAEYDRGKWKPK